MTGASSLRALPRLLQQASRFARAETSPCSSALQRSCCNSTAYKPAWDIRAPLHGHWQPPPTPAAGALDGCHTGAAYRWQPWTLAQQQQTTAADDHWETTEVGRHTTTTTSSSSSSSSSSAGASLIASCSSQTAREDANTGCAPHVTTGILAASSLAATAALAATGGPVDAAMLGGVGQVLAFSMWSGQRHSWLRALGAPSYLPLMTASLLAVNLGVFAMQQLDPGIIYHLGEIPYKIRNGELWRLITPVFLHSGVLHLLVNSYALYSLGSALEGMLGRARFGTIYFGSAVAGNATAALMTANSYHVGMGSSTALYGLFGAYVVDLLLTRGLRGAFATGEMNNVLVTMGINAAITLSVPGLSIWGHAGGFAGGAALLYLTRGWRRWRY